MPRTSYNKVPLTLRLTPIQSAVLSSVRYGGTVAVIVRFFLNKLINDELPAELKKELQDHLDDYKGAA
jgi:hypothetical protein